MKQSDINGNATSPRNILAIDLGGTHAAFAVISDNGSVNHRGKLRTRDYDSLEKLLDELHSLTSSHDFQAVAFCAPAVDSNGDIVGAVDLPWPSPLHLTHLTSEKFNLPCVACNDANAAALGEARFGSAKGMNDFIVLTLGTGIGAGVVCDGKLLLGNRGLAGELGHTLIRRGNYARPCSCGRRGCLETYCSARGIVATALDLINSDYPDSSLHQTDPALLTPQIICNAANNGDPAAIETFRQTGLILGEACADFAACFSPEAIILFGGITGAGDLLLKPTIEAFNRDLLYIYKDNVNILISSLPGADAALLGAAANALNQL